MFKEFKSFQELNALKQGLTLQLSILHFLNPLTLFLLIELSYIWEWHINCKIQIKETMKHAALILMVLIGTSAVALAQDGKKQKEPAKTDTKKVSKRSTIKEAKKQEGPAKKIN